MSDRKKLLIIDGNSILNRAFYGVRPMTTKDGRPTNAIYGFINMILRAFCIGALIITMRAAPGIPLILILRLPQIVHSLPEIRSSCIPAKTACIPL